MIDYGLCDCRVKVVTGCSPQLPDSNPGLFSPSCAKWPVSEKRAQMSYRIDKDPEKIRLASAGVCDKVCGFETGSVLLEQEVSVLSARAFSV